MKLPATIARFTLLLTCLSLLAVGCNKPKDGEGAAADAKGGGGGGAPQGPPPVPVVVEPVLFEDYAPAIDLVGEMRASQQAVLAAEVSGKVISIAHRIGEKHPRGSALIKIDPASYQAAVASAAASLDTARAQLAQLEAGPRSQELAAQEASVASAEARYNRERDNLERQQELYAEGVVAETALVAAKAAADSALADLDREREVLSQLRAGSRSEELDAQRARVSQAESLLQSARLQLQRTSIAPAFDAVVSQLMVEVGQYVGPGSPLATVVAAKDKGTAIDIEAWFALPQQRAGLVSDGDTVQIRSDALPVGADGKPAVITGTVVSVSPTADSVTRQFPMRVRVTDQRLKPGMAVRARLLTEMPQKQVMIPVDATVVSTLGQVVYRMLPPAAEGELPSVEAVPIETGEFVDKLVVVTKSELKPGDMIVTRGKEQLYPTAKIIPTNLKPPEGAPAPGGPPAEGAPAPADPAAETKTEGKTETAK